MTWEHLHAEEARSIGEAADSIQELTGEAPPCGTDGCSEPAVIDGCCEDCHNEQGETADREK